MNDKEGTASNGTPTNGVADAGASPTSSASVAEASTAGAAIPGSVANPPSVTTGSTPQLNRANTVVSDYCTKQPVVVDYRESVPSK